MIDSQARFSDEETRQIIAWAAQRQEDTDRVQLGTGAGLTFGALQEVARDAGIDPLHVRAAAKDILLRRDAPPIKTRAGLPLELRVQRVVPGSVSDGEWERMVAEFRQTFRKSGSVSQFGAVREWISQNEASNMPITVRLEPVDEGTLVTLHQSTKTMSDLVYAGGGSMLATGAIIGVLAVVTSAPGAVMAPILLFAVLAVLGSLGPWAGCRAWIPRQRERFRAVLDRAELIARAG